MCRWAVHNSVEVRLSFRSEIKARHFFDETKGSGFLSRKDRDGRIEVFKCIECDILEASNLGEEAFKVMRSKTDAEVSIEFYTVKVPSNLIGDENE